MKTNTKSYYDILQISQNASADDIRRAYRKLARTCHPDVSKEADAEERFKKLSEAYEVLKDPERRRLYDLYGENWQAAQQAQQNGGFNAGSTGNTGRSAYWNNEETNGGEDKFHFSSSGNFSEGENLDDFLRDLFGRETEKEFRGSQYQNYAGPQPVQEFELHIPLREAAQGTTRSITLQRETGISYPSAKTLKVTIPKGITDGSVLRIKDTDDAGYITEIHLRIKIAPDPTFSLKGHDLQTVVGITPWEAALGAKIAVETLEGRVNVTVPKNTQNGRRLRLRGKGMPKRNGSAGDIIVTLEIRMPTKISEPEAELFRQLAGKTSFNPRKTAKGQHAQSAGQE